MRFVSSAHPARRFIPAYPKGVWRTFDTLAIPGISHVTFGVRKNFARRNKFISKLRRHFEFQLVPVPEPL
jgi:hypothetical protein